MNRYVILLLAINGLAISDATLTYDINDFLALFPTDSKISDIIVKHFTSDEETEKTIEYVLSRLDSLTNLPELEAAKNFLKDAGLEPSVAINATSRIFGMSNLIVAWSSSEKTSEVIISGGFEGFFRDILGAFPTESIAALRQKKLISSPFFATFVEKITSEEFQERVTALQATNEYQELFKLLSPRVNLFDFVNLFASAIGLGSNGVAYGAPRPSRSLRENSNDFIQPRSSSDDVTKYDEKYKMADSEIRRVMRYLDSDKFTELLSSSERTSEYIALEKNFQDAGFDLKSAYRKLYRTYVPRGLATGYANAEPNPDVAIVEGLRGFLADYRDRKSNEKIAALYRMKRADSGAFDTLIERTDDKSNDFIAIRDALKAKEALEKIKQKLFSTGDSDRDYVSFLTQLIGIYIELAV